MHDGTKSNATKSAIVASLCKLLQEHPLDAITVKDIVEDCGISRQTFYYHFQDIYSVLDWQFQRTTQVFLHELGTSTWKNILQDVIDMVRAHKQMILNVYPAFDRSYVDHYLTKWTRPAVERIIEEKAKNYYIDADRVDFVVDLYAFGLVNTLLTWMDRGMTGGIVDRMDYFFILLENGVDDALRHLSQ